MNQSSVRRHGVDFRKKQPDLPPLNPDLPLRNTAAYPTSPSVNKHDSPPSPPPTGNRQNYPQGLVVPPISPMSTCLPTIGVFLRFAINPDPPTPVSSDKVTFTPHSDLYHIPTFSPSNPSPNLVKICNVKIDGDNDLQCSQFPNDFPRVSKNS